MIKGFLGSLIAALVLFAAGSISAAVLGTNELEVKKEVQMLDWNEHGEKMINERVTGEKTWYFDERTDIREIEVNSSNVKTYIAPSKDNRITVSVQTNGWKSVSVKAEQNDPFDGRLNLSVSGNTFGNFVFFGGNNGTVIIGLPDVIYDKLTLDLGSGTLEARDIGAKENEFDVGSGHFEFSQKKGFTADMLELDMGSGSAKIANAATRKYKADMGSGSVNVSDLSGSGTVDVGSGKLTVEFAEIGASESRFDLGSGKLNVYVPSDTKADLYTEIGSGSVVADCCGVSEKIRGDSHIQFNPGADGENGTLYADVGSGKIEFLNSSEYEQPDMFDDFPNRLVFNTDEAVVKEATVTEAAVIQNRGN